MGQHLTYTHTTQWVTAGAVWRPSKRPPTPDVLTLYDPSTGGVLVSNLIATMTLTLYDLTEGVDTIVDAVNIKNTRDCTISNLGILVLILQGTDTAMLNPLHPYEERRVMIDYTWPLTPTRADTLIIDFIVRARYPATTL